MAEGVKVPDARQSTFNPWYSHGGRREPARTRCPLVSMHLNTERRGEGEGGWGGGGSGGGVDAWLRSQAMRTVTDQL